MNFLILQSNYNQVEVALFKDSRSLLKISIDKVDVSKKLIRSIDSLLKNNLLRVDDLSFIGCNLGPAPFTTLRVVLATLNAISQVKKIPLVGVDGLKIFISEIKKVNPNSDILILLNAFGGDIYFGYLKGGTISTGYKKLEDFLKENCNSNSDLYLAGNALEKYQKEIAESFPNAHVIEQNYVSLESISEEAFARFNNSFVESQLLPLYLKEI